MKKCWTSIICVCCMLLLIPAALAGRTDNAELLTVIVASGPCGAENPEDLIWTLDENGTMTFVGSGAMADYEYVDGATTAPWVNYRKQIKSVVIPKGVTRIGATVFCGSYGDVDYSFSALASVTIADSVTSIGYLAFCNCDALTQIELPGSVQQIGRDAFNHCSFLSSVTLPASVTSIGYGAFKHCERLAELTIPASVTEIGVEAFAECPKLTLTVSPDSYAWRYALENTLRHKVSGGDTVYIAGGPCGAGKPYDLIWALDESGAMTFTGSGAMADYAHFKWEGDGAWTTGAPWFPYHSQIKSVNIPYGVTRIGSSAFYGSDDHQFPALSSVTLPDSVISFGELAFCNCDALAGMEIPHSVKTIERDAFNHCDILSALTLPASVASIGENAFKDCPKLTLTVYEGSYAHRYALLNSVRHEAIQAQFGIRNVTHDGQTVKVDIENSSGISLTLAVVAYAESGKFVRLATTATDSSGAVTIALDTAGAKTVRAFLLDSDAYRPLCEGKPCDIQ